MRPNTTGLVAANWLLAGGAANSPKVPLAAKAPAPAPTFPMKARRLSAPACSSDVSRLMSARLLSGPRRA